MTGRSRARWGWYRLADDVADALVEAGAVGSTELVLDLGAGDGVITSALVRTGARVTVLTRLTPRRSTMTGAALVLPVAVAGRWQDRLAHKRSPWMLSIERRVPRSSFRPRPRVD